MPHYMFSNIDTFNDWHNKVMADLGIPDEHTLTYTEPIIHPTNGTVVANVDERPDMSNYQMVSREDLYELGYKERPVVNFSLDN